MKRVAWVTGAGGFLGSYLVREAARHAPEVDVIGLLRPELDLSDEATVEKRFLADRPEAVIHCAALSRTGDCANNPGLARRMNVEVTRHLAGLAEQVPFVLFSTDLVFDGAKGDYRESDPVNPLSVYAETKAEAERVVSGNPRHSVVRISLNAGVSTSGGRSFTETIRAAWQGGQTLRFFRDEFRSPLGAVVTARAVWELVRAGRPGLYHIGGAERLSRLAIGELLARRWPNVRALMEAASIHDYAGPRRPADTSLNSERVQGLLSFPLPGFRRWLEENPDEPV